MLPRRLILLLLGIVIFLLALPALADTPVPPGSTPVPTATPVSPCPPGLQETCAWVPAATRTYGPWLLLIAAALIALWFVQRFRKVAETKVEKAAENIWDDATQTDALNDAAARYLAAVIEDYRFVKFRGLGSRARGIEPPELDQVFISLHMLPEDAREDSGKRARAAAKGAEEEDALPLGRAASPVNLTEAISISPRLAIVGAAGSGKSTLLQWAGLAAARARLSRKPLADEPAAFVAALGAGRPPLPLLLPLRDYNRYCREKHLDRSAETLLAFMPVYVAAEHPALKLPDGFFAHHLGPNGDGCLLMFDGVDEVAPDDRPLVRQAIEDLLSNVCAPNPRNRYLITSRTQAYFGPAEVSGFRECRVQNLEPEERDRLIHRWYASVEPADKARLRAQNLCDSIRTSDQRVRDVAVTPLMVTIFALVHYDGGELPHQRAALYEKAVTILLTEAPFKEGEGVKELEKWGGLDPGVRRNRLAQIAFAMHSQPNQLGDEMAEDDLLEIIWPGFGAERQPAREQARLFIALASDRGGLLEFQNERYGFFTHRTFREFLAGRYLAEELSGEWERELSARFQDDQWREPILLAAGYLAINGEARANTFIRQVAQLGLTDDERAQALTLAGLALADLPVDTDAPLDPRRVETRGLLVNPMLKELIGNPPTVAVEYRRRLGLALGALGDPRLPPANAAAIALPELVTIPAGEFRMGTSPDEARWLKVRFEIEAWYDEQPDHPVHVSEFQMSRYPVTNAEYGRFVRAGGYDPDQPWWQGEARLWRLGEANADLSIYSDDTRTTVKEWLERRPLEKRQQPFFWDDPQWNASNLPVVGVTWYEAAAYCQWLSARTGQAFRLPTEAEWEKAARGPQAAQWPWGNDWEDGRCNSEEAGLNATTPVGMFPHGAAAWPAGSVDDLVGNVFEWCADWWDDGLYQKRIDRGETEHDPQGPEKGSARVVRGGSYFLYRRRCRAAYRNRLVPAYFDLNAGFRVVRSP